MIYVTDTYRQSGANIPTNAKELKRHGDIPVAWPHDSAQRDKGSGEAIAALYKASGVKMLAQHATHPDGSSGVEAGIMEMQERMETGRLRVFSTCTDWFEEFRMYHRKNGIIVKERDDILSATRYGVMMKRFAKPVEAMRQYRKARLTVAKGVELGRNGNSLYD